MKGKNVLVHPYVVSYSVGATVNIGNYESRRVTIGLSIPVYEAKKIRPTLKKIQKIVDEELKKKVEEVRKEEGITGEVSDIEEVLEEDLE